MLQWTTPMMLAGLGLLSLPIIAHLLNRKSNETHFIPTIRFLKASATNQNRFLKLRRWLLLILRGLAVAAIVCMFARPVWWQGANASSSKDSVGMAVVIDRSLSTTQIIGNTSLFQSFLGAATRSLGELKNGSDFATIVLAGDTPEPLQRKLVPNIPDLKTKLKTVVPSLGRADIPGAIAEAARQLNLFEGRRVLVVISDMQRSNWTELVNDSSSGFDLPPDTEVRFVQQQKRSTSNVALSNARCDPPNPTIGQLATLSVTTTNFTEHAKQIPISLFAGGEKLDERVLTIEPGQASIVSFQIKCSQTWGYRFAIPSDNLTVDDEAFVAISSSAVTPVAVISDDGTDIGSSKFFLERAVSPFNGERDRYQIRSFSSKSIKSGSLDGQEIVVVGYISNFTNKASDELLKFVKSGGRLLYLCGEGNVARQLSKIEERAGDTCFPFGLTKLDRFKDFGDMLQIQSGKWRSRWLRAFDLPSQLGLQQIRFDKAWAAGQIREGAEVLLQYSDGRPALGYSTYGDGTIVLANLSPSVDFSEFGKFGSFAAFVQMILGQLQDQDSAGDLLQVGSSVNFLHKLRNKGGDENPLSVIGPSGDKLKVRITKSEDSISLLGEAAGEPGFYELRSADEVLQVVSVAIDPRESDLAYLDQVEVNGSLEASDSSTVSAERFGLNLIDRGNPLWGWLAVGSVAMMASESFLLGWWKR